MWDARPLVVVAGIAAIAWLQGTAGDANSLRRRSDFRYTPDPRVIRVVAGAHRSTTADLLWLRTMPDLGRDFADVELKTRWIDNSLAAITDLEPSFMTVYDFGQAYLTHLDKRTKGAADRAIALLQKGIDKNPDVAGLRIRQAMIWFLEKKDRAKTIEVLQAASTLPDFDSLSAGMLTGLLAHDRADVLALAYFARLMEQSSGEMHRVAELNLWRVKAAIARRATIDFKAAHGRPPAKPSDLADPKLIERDAIELVLQGLEIDAAGVPRYARAIEMENEEIIVQADRWARQFRDESGHWPTLDDFKSSGFGLPAPPEGQTWQVVEGKLSSVPAAGTAPPPK